VIIYYFNRVFARLAKAMIKVKYITLVNLLAEPKPFVKNAVPYNPRGKDAHLVPFPEYPTCEDRSAELAAHVVEWLTQPTAYRAKVRQLAELRARVGHAGASRRAAEYILQVLQGNLAQSPATAKAA
jgi:lipid-A-disaccharide synthase